MGEPAAQSGAKAASGKKLVIAIDGPAGSGKSTLAALLARKYHYTNIETGAMYRALALKAIENGTPLENGPGLAALAQQSRIELVPDPEGNRVLLDGADITERLRSQDVTDAASKVSVHPPVREWMVASQRRMGEDGGIRSGSARNAALSAKPRRHGPGSRRGGRVARARPARPHPRQLAACARARRRID
jgi:cytidylate kinase